MAKRNKKKNWTNRYLRVLSRHPSHDSIRKTILAPSLGVIRFGSTTEWNKEGFEINSIESIKNSSSKRKMKTCFTNSDVKTALWWKDSEAVDEAIDDIEFPILAKRVYGSRGEGMKKFENADDLYNFIEANNNIANYIFEKYYNYSREYRMHVSANGCFYACRKMLKSDTPQEERWFRNDSNCVWYLDDNDNFDKPTNWDAIEAEAVKALKSVGLDVGACDIRVQSATTGKGKQRENPEFIIVEINSAPSFGEVTLEKYKEEIPKIINSKL